jgi:hypothetical protein
MTRKVSDTIYAIRLLLPPPFTSARFSFRKHFERRRPEDWPIFIEDLNGNTHEVVLTPGDILFYESSKVKT